MKKKLPVASCQFPVVLLLALGLGLHAQAVKNSNGVTAVSGTIAAAQGAAAANTAAWPIKITDGGSNSAGWYANNLQVLAGGTDPQNGNGYTTARISGFGDNTTTNWGSLLASAELLAYNGNSGFDRLRSSTADGSGKTGVLEANPVAAYVYVHAAGTAVVKATPGILHKLIVNTPAAGTISLFDIAAAGCTGTPGSGQFAAITLNASSQPAGLAYDLQAVHGICIVTSAAMDVTLTIE